MANGCFIQTKIFILTSIRNQNIQCLLLLFLSPSCSSFYWAFNFQTQRFFFHEVEGKKKYYRWNATKNQVSWIKVLSYASKFVHALRFCSINIMYIYLLQCTKFFFIFSSSSSFSPLVWRFFVQFSTYQHIAYTFKRQTYARRHMMALKIWCEIL